MRKLFLMCLALCLLLILAQLSFAGDEITVKGYVADSKCAAMKNGADPKTLTPEQLKKYAECNRKCIKEGAKMVVVTDDDRVLTVENPKILQGHEEQHVQVSGHLTGTSLHVSSMKLL
jgi:hypothetical protein